MNRTMCNTAYKMALLLIKLLIDASVVLAAAVVVVQTGSARLYLMQLCAHKEQKRMRSTADATPVTLDASHQLQTSAPAQRGTSAPATPQNPPQGLALC